MIPETNKDHGTTKRCRSTNLINCIAKLGEKVVADRLQFGSVKRRSAIEAVAKVVRKAERCLPKGGKVGWNFWDGKAGFQGRR